MGNELNGVERPPHARERVKSVPVGTRRKEPTSATTTTPTSKLNSGAVRDRNRRNSVSPRPSSSSPSSSTGAASPRRSLEIETRKSLERERAGNVSPLSSATSTPEKLSPQQEDQESTKRSRSRRSGVVVQHFLPEEIMERIFSFVTAKDLFNCATVSTGFLYSSSRDKLWERLAFLDIQTPEIYEALLYEYSNLFPSVHLPPHLLFSSLKPFYWKSLYVKYKFKELLQKNPLVRTVYDYVPRTERELACCQGEVLELISQDPEPNSCWWLVQNVATSGQGWVPSGYLEDVTPQERVKMMMDSAVSGRIPAATTATPSAGPKYPMVRALYSYVATNESEISFKEYDLMSVLKKGGRLDGEWETDFEDLGLSKKEREKRKRDHEVKERDEFPEEDERFYWWKASLTRRAKDGPGNVTVEGWIPGNMVTERVEYKIAVMDYEGAGENELSLRKGQRVAVLEVPHIKEHGWLFVQSSGQRGWAPENYLADD